MRHIFIVRKTVDAVEWKATKDGDEIKLDGCCVSNGCGKDKYPFKVFPTFKDAKKWIEEDEDLFIKEYCNEKYQLIHQRIPIYESTFLMEPDGTEWVDAEYYFFKQREQSKVNDYFYQPRACYELTIRSRKPNNQHICKPYGQFQGQQCLYYVERTFIDEYTGFGGELRHSTMHCA